LYLLLQNRAKKRVLKTWQGLKRFENAQRLPSNALPAQNRGSILITFGFWGISNLSAGNYPDKF
jgi:hypothetical protein